MTDSPDPAAHAGRNTNKRAQKRAGSLLAIAGALVLLPAYLLSLVVFSAPDWWIADLFVHFKLHYLAAGCLGLLLFGMTRRPWLAATAGLTVAVNLMPVLQYFDAGAFVDAVGPANATTQERKTPADPGWAHFRIASANIYKHNERFDLVADWIMREKPDVAVLLEAGQNWRNEMRTRLPQYPHQVLVASPRRAGKLVISRLPIENIRKIELQHHGRSPVPVLTITAKQAAFKLYALHASWPLKKQWAADRNEELAELARTAASSDLPFIAVGDFNITPFSRYFQRTLQEGKLQRAAAGRGWLPTWPTFFLPAGIQIDHVLTNTRVHVTDYQVGGGLNSDHRWVMAEVAIPMQATQATQPTQR